MEATGFNFNTFSEKPSMKSGKGGSSQPDLKTEKGRQSAVERTLELSDLTLTATAKHTNS